MLAKEEALGKIKILVERFDEQKESYKKTDYNETQTRRDFIDKFWTALGWEVDNESGCAEMYREVIQEDHVIISGKTKSPDYSFRLPGGKRLFFLEAKKPSINIYNDQHSAYQIRRYGWSAKMAICVITNFEDLAIYDCSIRPKVGDNASKARIRYLTYSDYIKEFDFIWNTFSKSAVLKAGFDKFIQSDQNKKGTSTVDEEFLMSLDKWRLELAENIAKDNLHLNLDELVFAVLNILDRIIFLRIAEDRNLEPYGALQEVCTTGNYYENLLNLFYLADKKYNSGLFDFNKDSITPNIKIDNKVIRVLISEFYYPFSPYEFSVISVEILGSAYEQFLGKQISLSQGKKPKLDYKPDVRKAGGVYYTPQYIVDYIVKNTVGKLIENKTPEEVSKIKILDPACGSGSFLIGAYQYLLNWHKDYYLQKFPSIHGGVGAEGGRGGKGKNDSPLTPTCELTIAEKKRILLNNIYGVDLDSNAVELAKLSLLLKCLEGETKESIESLIKYSKNARVLPTLDNNIKCGNSLVEYDYYDINPSDSEQKLILFSWEEAFPEVFKREVPFDEKENLIKRHNQRVKQLEEDGKQLIETLTANESPIEYRAQNFGFNVVIGNPPYVKVSDKHLFNYFSEKYEHQDYQQDLYLLFLERYKKLLAKGGKLGVIIPNTWLQSIKFRNIRRYLVNEYCWERILHINQHIFKAVVDTHVLIFEKNNYVKNGEVTIDIYEKDEIHFHQYISQHKLPDNGEVINILSSDDEKKLFEKIKNSSIQISEICKTYSGITLFEKGQGTPPQTEETMRVRPYISENKFKPEGRNWLPLMRGSFMNKYVNLWKNNYWVDYGKWLAAPRDPKIFEAEEKIIVRQTGDRIIATLIGANIICRKNLHIIISENISHKFILGVLNSKLTDFYYFQINPEKGEALAEVKKQHVEQLPVPKNVSKEQETEIIKYVDQLLQLNKELQTNTLPQQIEQLKQRIRFCEEKIDKIVYELYELTEEEINIVIKNTKA